MMAMSCTDQSIDDAIENCITMSASHDLEAFHHGAMASEETFSQLPSMNDGTVNDSLIDQIDQLANNSNSLTDLLSATPSASSATVGAAGGGFGAEVMIPLYSIIFVLSVVGNILVIVTLTQNRRMRTVTNVFLLNLVSVFPILLIVELIRYREIQPTHLVEIDAITSLYILILISPMRHV